ncbi:flagellar assembly protein FliH [Salinivibrio sp. YCSC6]|uniref:flagellar assembly protein FliH n=1 Tax=Salinivibrio sp. YCSC6 TaxID=2003370 RepID=UPI000BBBBDE8|nr:flagellar assembly protein FliH [Salinivibrio sp. YCSC6]PCE67867.1 flagellar assembly protein FliH [Salinivibrio sp. YCSC6]QCF35239.1 flagellar assembly protein FliH [Salinivibrio sp. YCSC6]
MSLDKRRGYIRADEAQTETIDRWELPPYGDKQSLPKETALNYDPSWEPEPEPEPEESELAPEPLTADALEAIRQQGYDEGHEEGKQIGHREGLEAGLEEGREKGHEEGKKAGFDEGFAAGQALIEERCQHLDRILNQLTHPLEKVNKDVEQQLLLMVQALTKSLIGVEVQTNPHVILQTLRAAIEALPIADHPVTVSLHPDDHAVVSDAYGPDTLAARDWTLQSEPALSRGDVHVKAKDSVVDYRLAERVDTLLREFHGKNQARPSDAAHQHTDPVTGSEQTMRDQTMRDHTQQEADAPQEHASSELDAQASSQDEQAPSAEQNESVDQDKGES